VLGVPARYIHTHNSVIHLNDVVSALRLVLALAEALDQAAVDQLTAYPDA
jgi:putative aminopeptidase FrvX